MRILAEEIVIYVEGNHDKSFISYFLRNHLAVTEENRYTIELLGGKGNIKKNPQRLPINFWNT